MGSNNPIINKFNSGHAHQFLTARMFLKIPLREINHEIVRIARVGAVVFSDPRHLNNPVRLIIGAECVHNAFSFQYDLLKVSNSLPLRPYRPHPAHIACRGQRIAGQLALANRLNQAGSQQIANGRFITDLRLPEQRTGDG